MIGNLNRHEVVTTFVFEPVNAGQKIHLAVAINVCRRHAFLFDGGLYGRRVEDLRQGPGPGITRVVRDICHEQLPSALVPEHELRLPCTFEIGNHLVVMGFAAALLDEPLLPWGLWVELRRRVFVPPQFVTARITTDDQVQVAVAVDIVRAAAGFGTLLAVVNDVLLPTSLGVAQPDDGWGTSALGNNDIRSTIPIDIKHDTGGLLCAAVGLRQIAGLARDMFPCRYRHVRRTGDGMKKSSQHDRKQQHSRGSHVGHSWCGYVVDPAPKPFIITHFDAK